MYEFKVIKGIFEGHTFKGEISHDGNRVHDLNSFGRSYPVENCKLII